RDRVRQAGRGGGDRLARRAGRTAVPRARHAPHARPARGVREAGGAAGPALRAAAPVRAERARDPHVHPAADGLMAWRTSHFVAAAQSLPVRRLRPGLKFDLRRLKTDSIARRVTVRLSPERRLTLVRGEGETGWVETVETIPWAITRLRVTGTIESSLYDALDK